jgi:3-oxoacyl-[acyl-carrier-protein] synthase-3
VPYENVFIESLAIELPPHRVETGVIEEELAPTYRRLGIPKHCIETLVGIKARRFWQEGTEVADAAAKVARKALAAAPGLDVALLISSSVSKDYVEPSVAALVAGELQLPPSCLSFDVGNACLGFMSAMELAAQQIESGRIGAALVVAAESSRHVVARTVERLNAPTSTMQDFKEALATLTLGSGAVAMLLTHRRTATTTHQLHGSVTRADPKSSRICLGTPEWMRTDATRLLAAGVDLAAATWAEAERQLGWRRDDVAQFICHQVGAAHMATLFKRLELDLDRAHLTYPELGNIGPAAVPLTLALAVDAGRVRTGDSVALMGIGSGLSCCMMSVTW